MQLSYLHVRKNICFKVPALNSLPGVETNTFKSQYDTQSKDFCCKELPHQHQPLCNFMRPCVLQGFWCSLQWSVPVTAAIINRFASKWCISGSFCHSQAVYSRLLRQKYENTGLSGANCWNMLIQSVFLLKTETVGLVKCLLWLCRVLPYDGNWLTTPNWQEECLSRRSLESKAEKWQ